MRLLLDIAGDIQLNRELTRVSTRAQDPRPAFEAIADLWIAETRKQFATEGRHASGGWKPLKTATVKAKQRAHQRPEILRATDDLLKSLTEREDENMILDISTTELGYGSKLPYAAAHQNPKASNPLPQRRPVALTETARRDTVKILQRFLITGEIT